MSNQTTYLSLFKEKSEKPTNLSKKMDEQKKAWGGARPGAGRKRSGQTRATIGISVSKSYADMLKQAAADENTTPGRYIENHLPLNNI